MHARRAEGTQAALPLPTTPLYCLLYLPVLPSCNQPSTSGSPASPPSMAFRLEFKPIATRGLQSTRTSTSRESHPKLASQRVCPTCTDVGALYRSGGRKYPPPVYPPVLTRPFDKKPASLEAFVIPPAVAHLIRNLPGCPPGCLWAGFLKSPRSLYMYAYCNIHGLVCDNPRYLAQLDAPSK